MNTDTYKAKISHIVPTFLVIGASSVAGFMLVRWLNILFNIIDFKDRIWELYIPMALPWIPIILWLRPRLRILAFKKKGILGFRDNESGRFFFQLIAWITIGLSMAISQAYLTTATGKLVNLKNINEIAFKENVRYYKVSTFTVDTAHASAYTDFHITGKHNQTLNFDSYFVIPIVNKNTKSTSNNKYWYGIYFHDDVSNHLSDTEKESAFRAFYKSSLKQLSEYDFYNIDHFERVPTSDKKDFYFKAIQNSIKKPADAGYAVLTPIKDTYEKRNGNKLIWIFGSFIIGLVFFLLALLAPIYNRAAREKFLRRENPKSDDVADMPKC